MHKLKEMLMGQLYEYEEKAKKMTGGKISATELQNIHTLTDTIKNIDKIEMLEDGGYSEDGEWEAYGSYDGGSSYARGRNAKRDSMGRYSRESGYSEEGRQGNSYARQGMNRGYRRDNYSRDGYSRDGAKEYMIEQLEEMKENVGSEKERQAISHCIKQLEMA